MEPAKIRIYAFDTLRTVMVLLGLVIHASIIYNSNVFNNAIFFNDPKSHTPFFNVLADGIHIFRMPVFYTLSGFFTALIFFERGKKTLVQNRLHRLVYPFIAGLLVLLPLHLFSLNFFAVCLSGTQDISDAFVSAAKRIRLHDADTIHLWFIYYLIWFCASAYLLSYVVNRWFPNIAKPFFENFRKLFHLGIAPAILAVPTAICLYFMDTYDIKAEHSFLIHGGFFVNYGLYFFFGWLCYGLRNELNRFEKNAWLYLTLGLALYVLRWALFLQYPEAVPGNLNSLLIILLAFTTWFFVFGIIGCFIKHFNNPSKVSKYISDGSYWIYLIHMPIVLVLQALLLRYDLSAFIKFTIVLIVTLSITILSYNYLVRNTFIGQFLNGRKYPRAF
ncbi:MAG TPA: acyltransferase family protein [Flavobacterium sp.]|nr:acyltransferase family protein [Flavobacterium sp.]